MTDQQLVEMFADLARDLPAAPDRSLREGQQRADRRPTLHRVTLAAAALVVIVGTVGVLVLRQPASGPVVDDAGPTESPPPTEEGPVTMLLSPAPFPATGGPLALTVVNRSAQDFSYGVGGQLDKWVDGAWQPIGGFASALTFWHGPGRVVMGDEPLEVNDILLSALPRKAGPLEWLSLPRLEPGWYRLTHSSVDDEQRVAAAVLRVSEDAEGPELIAPGDGPVLNLEPAALEPGAHQLRFVLTAPEQDRGEDIPDLRASMAQTTGLEVWGDSTWKEVAELEVDMNPPQPRGNLYEWTVQLPNLDAGAYRLVQNSNTAGPVVGHFWITELLTERSPTDSGTLGERPSEPTGADAAATLTDLIDDQWPPFAGTYQIEQLDHETGRMQGVRRGTIEFNSPSDWEVHTNDGQRNWFRDGRWCTNVPGPDGDSPDCRTYDNRIAPSDWLQPAWPSLIPTGVSHLQWHLWDVERHGDSFTARLTRQEPCRQLLPDDSCDDPERTVEHGWVVTFGDAGIPHAWYEHADGTVIHRVQFTELTIAGQQIP